MRARPTRSGYSGRKPDCWCFLAVVITGVTFGDSHPDMVYLLKMYTAAGAIIGHNFPFYLKFKGGKGIAATAGLILSFHPYLIPMGIILFFGAFFITHYVSLGSLLVYAGFMIELIILGQMGIFGMSQAYLIEMYVIAGFLTVMAYWKHRDQTACKRYRAENLSHAQKYRGGGEYGT